MAEALQQTSGCLTPRGLDALRGTAGVPPELARHLAGCPSCQRRALAVDAPRVQQARAARPDGKRLLVYAGAILALALLALFGMLRLR